MSDFTAKERRHIERICGGSRLLAELAVDAISLQRLNVDAPKPCLYRSIHELVLRHGWFFKPRPFLAKYRKGRDVPHDCFLNALRLAVGAPGLAYVEGFALLAKGILQRPVAHSWCVDTDGNVVDPTWHGRPGAPHVRVRRIREGRRRGPGPSEGRKGA